jgi:cytochrome b subunit of formate dehydrogenase
MSGWSGGDGRGARRLLSLETHLRAQYALAVVCVIVLAATGLPQKFDSLSLCRGLIDLAGGIETLRLIHHVAGGVLIFTGVYHVALVLTAILVLGETAPLRMIPTARDVRDAVQGTADILRPTNDASDGRDLQYVRKFDYWFMAWSFVVMAGTGIVNLMPLRFATVVSSETVLASLRTHSDAALLVLVWVIFVHLPSTELTPQLFRRWAPSSGAKRVEAGASSERAHAAAAGPEPVMSPASAAERRLGELRAKDREGSP